MKKIYNIYFPALLVAAAICAGSCVKTDYGYPQDLATPTPNQATNYINETFDELAKVNGQILFPPPRWRSFALAGIRTFQTGVLAKDGGGVVRGVMGSGYLSRDTVNDFWLMTPPLDVSDSTATLTFQTGLTYEAATTTFTLMYSETYRGGKEAINPNEWKELPFVTPPTTSGAVKMYAQGPISLWGKGGDRKVAYVAFRYRSKVSLEDIASDNADRANYYLDNVVFRRK
ncbi:MAG: choice-of-anchor J domain-containing protein [Prevotellaceae bacterium]|jgi:hypothetical protein|nr:choice-of-anchor J domain-containing protein [Prevotellaceae bacterium]